MTPFETALSSWREAARVSSSALAWSPASTASRALRIAVLSDDLIDWLRWRRFSLVLIRLIWDLIFATNCLFTVLVGGYSAAGRPGSDPITDSIDPNRLRRS